MNISGTQEPPMLRTLLGAVAEITSIATFGTMVAVWAMILV
jgi:hypothetical protein